MINVLPLITIAWVVLAFQQDSYFLYLCKYTVASTTTCTGTDINKHCPVMLHSMKLYVEGFLGKIYINRMGLQWNILTIYNSNYIDKTVHWSSCQFDYNKSLGILVLVQR